MVYINEAPLGERADTDRDRAGVKDRREALFGLPQRRFSALAIGDIMQHRQQTALTF